jgi:hypothetical protein
MATKKTAIGGNKGHGPHTTLDTARMPMMPVGKMPVGKKKMKAK